MNPLSEFGSVFQFSTDDLTFLEVEFDVHSDKVIPVEFIIFFYSKNHF